MNTDIYDVHQKREINVWIELTKGEQFIGKIYLDNDERLQDLMNDNRIFIPTYKLSAGSENSENLENYKMVILNKSAIIRIEEADSAKRK